jgi:hypothetical protein
MMTIEIITGERTGDFSSVICGQHPYQNDGTWVLWNVSYLVGIPACDPRTPVLDAFGLSEAEVREAVAELVQEELLALAVQEHAAGFQLMGLSGYNGTAPPSESFDAGVADEDGLAIGLWHGWYPSQRNTQTAVVLL